MEHPPTSCEDCEWKAFDFCSRGEICMVDELAELKMITYKAPTAVNCPIQIVTECPKLENGDFIEYYIPSSFSLNIGIVTSSGILTNNMLYIPLEELNLFTSPTMKGITQVCKNTHCISLKDGLTVLPPLLRERALQEYSFPIYRAYDFMQYWAYLHQ